MTHAQTNEINKVMPTVEFEVHNHDDTRPIPRVRDNCGWCGISLRAVPEHPKPYAKPGSTVIEYYHPTGCISAQRNADAMVPTYG